MYCEWGLLRGGSPIHNNMYAIVLRNQSTSTAN